MGAENTQSPEPLGRRSHRAGGGGRRRLRPDEYPHSLPELPSASDGRSAHAARDTVFFMKFLRVLGLALVLASPSAFPQTAAKKAHAAEAADVIDINSATEDQLRTIPGIGEAYSKKIIAG